MVNTPNSPNQMGRRERRKRETRANLLRAAAEVIGRDGVDALTIKEVTELADVGFGTFYSYFDSKDDVAAAILDCMINDIARRNRTATSKLPDSDPKSIPIQIRLLLRTAMSDPFWRWWADRPELLFDRLNRGIGSFAKRDVIASIRAGISDLSEDELDCAWDLTVWAMVGGIREVARGEQPFKNEVFVAEAVMRLLGIQPYEASKLVKTRLPKMPPPDIDWHFSLDSP